MALYNGMNEDEEDETTPYSSVSSRPPLPVSDRDLPPPPPPGGSLMNAQPDPVVKDFLSRKLATSKDANSLENDPLMKQYLQDQSNLEQYRRNKLDADLATNIGQSLSQLAQGVNTPTQNQVFKNIDKQSEDMLDSKEKDLDRRRKVMDAIEARKAREELEKGRRSEMNQRYQLAREDKMDAREQKAQEREQALAVPGFERTGEVLPKAEEAAKLRNASASASELTNKLGRLKELVNKYGSFELGGEGGQEMESLATEIQLLAKNQDMYNLGVLTGPDLGLLQKLTADPASIGSLFTRDKTRQKQIETQMKSITDKLNSKAASMGYKRSGVPSSQEKTEGKQVVKKQYSPSRNKTKLIYSDGSEEIIDGQG